MEQTRPRFSIIIPTHGRPKQIADCLRGMARLDYPRDQFEVIVVDDGRTGDWEAALAPFAGRLDIVVATQQRAGPAAARNAGAGLARGHFLAFTDDDCVPRPDWLRALESRFAVNPTCAVGGLTVNALPEDPYSTASHELVSYLYSYYNVDVSDARFFATNNLAVPAGPFRAIGGFDTSFPLAAAEDREFCERWRGHGWPMVYAEDAVIYHAHRLSFLTFLRQHFNYGRGALYLHRARARRGERRPKVEPLSFYVNLIRYPMSHGTDAYRVSLSLLLALSQVAYGLGYYWERLRHIPDRSDRRGSSGTLPAQPTVVRVARRAPPIAEPTRTPAGASGRQSPTAPRADQHP